MPKFPPTKNGYDIHECVSALQKAVRRSDPDAAIYWALEMQSSGFGGWAWKRLRTICSEDIGPGAPGLAADVRALHDNWKQEQKSGEPLNGLLYTIHACIALAHAPKSRVVDNGFWAWHRGPKTREIPDEALDGHTQRGKRMGRGHEFFMSTSSKLIDAGWDLDELARRYEDLATAPVVEVAPKLAFEEE